MKSRRSKSNELHPKSKAELKSRITGGYRMRDAHEELYSKKYHEVVYAHPCPMCGSRFDEAGMCACGTGDS